LVFKAEKMNYGLILNLKRNDFENLTPEQENILQTMRQWLHDYNLGKAEKPDWSIEARMVVSDYSNWYMAKEIDEDAKLNPGSY